MGQLVSLAGTWMQIVAQGWLVYQISGSEIALGVVGFASAIPALIITPWAGVIVDRVPKRNLLVATQASAMMLALVLAALTFTGVVQVWHVVVLAVCLGAVNAFDGPARQAFVVEMVGREHLSNAIALNSMTFNIGRIIGPALGGLVLAAVGAAWCFLLNGLTFVAVITSLQAMRLPPYAKQGDSASPWKQLTSGLSYVRSSPDLTALLLLALVFSVFGTSYSTVLPAFVDKVLHQGPGAFGAINAATGVGAVSAALLIARSGDHGRRGRWLMRAILIFPAILTIFVLTPIYPLALVLAAALGVGFMLTFTLINTLLQTQLADEMRGRVLSLYTLTFFGFTPFGNLFIGTMAEWIGLSPAIVLSAALCWMGAALIIAKTPSMRRLP
jgi:MFS family permease